MNYLSALYRRLAARRGPKRATIGVAHKLLIIAYPILRDGTCYSDLGADYFDRLNPEGLRRRLTKRLEGLGFKVTWSLQLKSPRSDFLRNSASFDSLAITQNARCPRLNLVC